MSDKGHSFQRLSGPRDEIVSRVNSFVPGEVDDLAAEREEKRSFYANLLEEERELAVDDLDCREMSGVVEVLPDVIEELEADFVDRHGGLLADVHAVRTGP